MGLGKFVAGRIHQMRSAKSYLAAHPSWSNEDPDATCPRFDIGPESFQHAILTCPARKRVRDLLLKDVPSLAHDATTWSHPILIRALAEYITDTKTGFPLDMLPDRYSTRSAPRLPQSRSMVPRGGFVGLSFCGDWMFCFPSYNFPCKKRLDEK